MKERMKERMKEWMNEWKNEDQGEYRTRKKMEIDDKTSKKDRPESFNDTDVVEKLKNIDDNHFIACFEKLGWRSGNDENCAARKIDAENGRIIEQQEISGEQCSADKYSFDSWRKRVPAEPVELQRQPDPQGGSQTKREPQGKQRSAGTSQR